jgi:large subunit ribosomal protein L25
MAENIELQAQEREGRGKGDARRLRRGGMLPAVLYADAGEVGESRVLAVPESVVDYTLTHVGDNALYNMKLGDEYLTARVVDVHRNPVSGKLVHVDFTPVNMRERIVITVPLTIAGEEPPGVTEGGVLDQVAYEVEVESLPGDIPQELALDVSGLQIGDNLTLGEVELPEGVELISDPDEVAAAVTPPTEISEEELQEAGILEEPSGEAAEESASVAPATAASTEGEEARGVEGTEEIPVEERETGPAGQNLQP